MADKKRKKDEKVSEKEGRGKEKKEETANVWKDWARFIENNENFHSYNPENHDVIRCGNGVSYRPNLDESTYQQHLKTHVENALFFAQYMHPIYQ